MKCLTDITASTAAIGEETIAADGSGSKTVERRKTSTIKLIKISVSSEALTSAKTAIESLVSSTSTDSEGSITYTALKFQITQPVVIKGYRKSMIGMV